MLVFPHPHQDPRSTVLDILEAPARDPDEECITVIQPGGDKGVDQFLCSREGGGGAKLSNIMEVEEGSFVRLLAKSLI